LEGRFAIVTDAGRDAVDAGSASDEGAGSRTVKSCGPDAPTLASSWWKRFRRRWWQKSPVTKESAKKPVKTIARGMPDVSGVTVVTNACAFYLAHAAADALSVRHSLLPFWGCTCALWIGRAMHAYLGRFAPRDREDVFAAIGATSLRGANATKQSGSPILDCFANDRKDGFLVTPAKAAKSPASTRR
jgi:hypothetical protein